MDRITRIERKAMTLVEGAGRYGVYLTHVGSEVVAIANWLETTVPEACRTIDVVVSAAREAAAREIARAFDQAVTTSSERTGRRR